MIKFLEQTIFSTKWLWDMATNTMHLYSAAHSLSVTHQQILELLGASSRIDWQTNHTNKLAV
jgi:hypothetical protein